MTESAARYALRTNNVAATDAIADNLEFLPNHLKKDPPFITARNLKGIMSKKGVTEYSQATNIFSYVESKVNSDNDAEEGQKWLQRFVEVLQLPDIGETGVARKIARSYVEKDAGCKFFSDIAKGAAGGKIQAEGVEQSEVHCGDESEIGDQLQDIKRTLDSVDENVEDIKDAQTKQRLVQLRTESTVDRVEKKIDELNPQDPPPGPVSSDVENMFN